LPSRDVDSLKEDARLSGFGRELCEKVDHVSKSPVGLASTFVLIPLLISSWPASRVGCSWPASLSVLCLPNEGAWSVASQRELDRSMSALRST